MQEKNLYSHYITKQFYSHYRNTHKKTIIHINIREKIVLSLP